MRDFREARLPLLKLRYLGTRISNVTKCHAFPSPGGAACNSLGRQPQVKLRWEFPAPEGRHTQLRDRSCVAPPGLFNVWRSIPGAHAPGYCMSPLRG
jgi:hypothetical protein